MSNFPASIPFGGLVASEKPVRRRARPPAARAGVLP
jgi:hypothetical protein